ncbi:PIN domain-like protein [Thamnidium elegans]|nr:PIN domain-like protein [Thamnidium elegans]
MGIQGLIPLLKSIQKPVEINEYAGQSVAVDGHGWLRRGVFSCSSELARGIETNTYVEYFMNLVKMLLFHKVIPIIVFEGQKLPIKKATTDAHASSRSAKLKEGKALFKDGKFSESNKLFQQSISVTPYMVAKVIKELNRYKIQHIVSPYEAAPQLTYMLNSNQVKAVITENSNLLAFGCSNVIFKMDRAGKGIQITCKDIFNRFVGITDSHKLRYMCILSGCDYLPSLPGIGLRKAQTIIKEHKTIENISQFVQKRFPKEYSKKFVKADAAFLYQFVFDSTSRTYIRLNPLPKDIEVDHLSGLGESPQNRKVPLLESNNAIHFDHNHNLKETKNERTDPFVQLNPSEFNEFEFDDSTLQDMEVLLKKVEPVVKPPSPPSSPPSTTPSILPLSRMTGLRDSSSTSDVKSSLSLASPSVNTTNTKIQLIPLLSHNGNKFTVWKDKKPEKSFFRPRSPPSSKPVIYKENVGHTNPSKQQPAQKRKSLLDSYPDPFAKIKKPFTLSDVSVARGGLSKK